MDLLTGSKQLKVGGNKSVLARKLDYIRNADGVQMKKMLQSYAGLDKRYLTEGPWANIEAKKSKDESQQQPTTLETQNSVTLSVVSDLKDDAKKNGSDAPVVNGVGDVTYARLQLKQSLALEKPFKVKYVLDVPEALRGRVNRTYLNFIQDCMNELEPVKKQPMGDYVGKISKNKRDG